MFRLIPRRPLRPLLSLQTAPFSIATPCLAKQKQMPSRPAPPPESEIDEMFVKGTGPGGQKINKTNSAVQLRHIPTGIVVKCQATRSRSENRAIARGLLAMRLDEIANPETCRTAALAAKKLKKRANATKKARRKYKKLAGEGEEGVEGEEEGEEEVEAEGQGGGDKADKEASTEQLDQPEQEQQQEQQGDSPKRDGIHANSK